MDINVIINDLINNTKSKSKDEDLSWTAKAYAYADAAIDKGRAEMAVVEARLEATRPERIAKYAHAAAAAFAKLDL